MKNVEHRVQNIRNGNDKVKQIRKEINELQQRLEEQAEELSRRLDGIEQANLVSVERAAEILDVSVSAIRKRADRGTLTKRNADGSKKITNRRTPVFFDEQEVRNKI